MGGVRAVKVYLGGQQIDLTQKDYVGAGGEGTIYARGGTSFKIYHDPSKMPPAGKLRDLAVLSDSRIIKPDAVVADFAGKPLGYTMRFVKDCWALCQLFPRSFRDRHGLTHEMVLGLVRQLREGVDHVHEAGLLIVDLNEMNFLASAGFDEIYFIDTDSWQTPRYPATAIMPSVRDWQTPLGKFTELSDWFSFGVVSFLMLTGIHPYKGRHPRVAGLEERMKAGLSVFNPDVRMPAAAYPLGVLPASYRAWYEAIFEKGVRCAPPYEPGSVVVFVQQPRGVAVGTGLAVELLREYDGPVAGMWVSPDEGTLVVATDKSVWVNGRFAAPVPRAVKGCGFSPGSGTPVLVAGEGAAPLLVDLTRGCKIPFSLNAHEVMSCDGRVYVRNGGWVYRVVLHEAGDQIIASVEQAAAVLEHATRLYSGVVLQSLLGAWYASVFPAPGETRQVRLGQLDEYRVVDARYDRGVLMVVGVKRGRYDRLVFRLDRRDDSCDVRVLKDVGPMGLNMVTLDTGVNVCLNEDANLEVSGARKGSVGLKVLADPALGGDMVLGRQGGVIFARGDKVYRLRTTGGVKV